MFVGRPFLLNRQNPGSNPNSPPEGFDNPTPASTGNQKQSNTREQLVEDCVNAAKEALEICRSLRDSGHGLARGSYIEYSSCRASLLVIIAYCVHNESSEELQPFLQDGLEMIRSISAAGDSARSEVALIEALERALKPHGDGIASTSVSQGSGYDTFKHWETMWKSGGDTHLRRNSLSNPTPSTFQPRALTSIWGSHVTPSSVHNPVYDWPTSILSQTYSDNFFVNNNHNVGGQIRNQSLSLGGDSLSVEAEGNAFLSQNGIHDIMHSDFDFDVSSM